MFDAVLRQMRTLVREGRFFVTPHADDELLEDDLTVFDVEHCVLNGNIAERQRDQDFMVWKYLIEGPAISGSSMAIVAAFGSTGRLIIITVYAL